VCKTDELGFDHPPVDNCVLSDASFAWASADAWNARTKDPRPVSGEKLNICERLLAMRVCEGHRLNLRVNPDGPDAVAFIGSREALIERLTEALAYYANDEHYDCGDVPGHVYVIDDHGRFARAALQAVKEA
jgi:hypothetical protein